MSPQASLLESSFLAARIWWLALKTSAFVNKLIIRWVHDLMSRRNGITGGVTSFSVCHVLPWSIFTFYCSDSRLPWSELLSLPVLLSPQGTDSCETIGSQGFPLPSIVSDWCLFTVMKKPINMKLDKNSDW